MKRSILSFIALISIILFLGACNSESSGSGDTVEIIANSVWPEGNHISQGLMEYAEKVDEATGGKVKIVVNTGGALGFEGPELLKAVRDNSVTMSEVMATSVAGDEPIFNVSTLPFVTQNFDEGKKFIEIARPYYEKVAEEKWNQKVLFGTGWPYAGFWTQDPVETLTDINGLKMRTYDENGAKVVQAAGGVPSPLPFSEVYPGLQTGVIDSVLTSSPTAVDAKFWEVLDYYVPTNVTAAYNIISINLDVFNKLDKETQDIMIEIGKEMDEIMWEKNLALDAEMESIVQEKGITILKPSQAFMDELSTIGKEIADEWLNSSAPEEAKEIIEKFNEEVGR
jgi:TRAP-type transport system periplasmic protein